jgi:hypothetical protein
MSWVVHIRSPFFIETMEPIGCENGIKKFSKNQVNAFGCPSFYGYNNFEVIETNESIEYASDYKMESNYYMVNRSVHVYSRLERFELVLSQLMCMSLNVSNRILKSDRWLDMIDEVAQIEENHWICTRNILKKYKFNTYYNRIPGIISVAQGWKITSFNNSVSVIYSNILKDFTKMDVQFEKFKGVVYKYFPNLRYVALKLMQHHQYYPAFDIPFAITKAKIVSLDKTFDDLWYFINTN